MSSTYSQQLFKRFNAIFGAQKMAGMWADMSREEVEAVWNAALRGYPPATIAKATQSLVQAGTGWPPTLPEFVAICRQSMTAAHQAPMLTHTPKSDPDVAQRAIEQASREVAGKAAPPDPLLALPVDETVVGRILAMYRREAAKGRSPNKRWACRLLLAFADGERLSVQQFELSCSALGLAKVECEALVDAWDAARLKAAA